MKEDLTELTEDELEEIENDYAEQLPLFQEEVDRLNKVSSTTPFMGYMGGKTQARKLILSCIPKDITEIVSPFVGGGSFELLAAASGLRVKAFDKFESLVRMWNIMLKDIKKVAYVKERIFPVNSKVLKWLNGTGKIHQIENDAVFAAIAWSMGNQAYSGLFMQSTFFKNTKSGRKAEKLIPYTKFNADEWSDWAAPNLSVELSDWRDTLDNNPGAFMYLDPPYVEREWYYGAYSELHKYKRRRRAAKGQFHPRDHQELADRLNNWDGGWILSYLDHPKIRKFYHGKDVLFMKYHQGAIAGQQYRHSMVNDELLILKPPAEHQSSIKYLKEDYEKQKSKSESWEFIEKVDQLKLFDQ